jgi:hypothetical protein
MISSAVWGKADYARLDAGFAIAIEVASDWRSFWAVVVVRDGRYTVLAYCAVLAGYTVLACCANLAICSHVCVLSRSRRRVGGHLIVDGVCAVMLAGARW